MGGTHMGVGRMEEEDLHLGRLEMEGRGREMRLVGSHCQGATREVGAWGGNQLGDLGLGTWGRGQMEVVQVVPALACPDSWVSFLVLVLS